MDHGLVQVMMEQGQGRLAGIVFIFLARVLHHWSAKLHHDGVNVVHNKHQSIVLCPPWPGGTIWVKATGARTITKTFSCNPPMLALHQLVPP